MNAKLISKLGFVCLFLSFSLVAGCQPSDGVKPLRAKLASNDAGISLLAPTPVADGGAVNLVEKKPLKTPEIPAPGTFQSNTVLYNASAVYSAAQGNRSRYNPFEPISPSRLSKAEKCSLTLQEYVSVVYDGQAADVDWGTSLEVRAEGRYFYLVEVSASAGAGETANPLLVIVDGKTCQPAGAAISDLRERVVFANTYALNTDGSRYEKQTKPEAAPKYIRFNRGYTAAWDEHSRSFGIAFARKPPNQLIDTNLFAEDKQLTEFMDDLNNGIFHTADNIRQSADYNGLFQRTQDRVYRIGTVVFSLENPQDSVLEPEIADAIFPNINQGLDPRSELEWQGISAPEAAKISPSYYSFKASYSLLETGEPLEVDVVVACGGVAFSNAATTDTIFRKQMPETVLLEAGTQSAMGVRVTDLCKPYLWENISGKDFNHIPEDLWPLAIWYEDKSDLSAGWGYETEAAYDGPRAKIAFHGASVELVDKLAWNDWRFNRAHKLRASDKVESSILYDAGLDVRTVSFEGSDYKRLDVAIRCTSVARVTISEDLSWQFLEVAPENNAPFWMPEKEQLKAVSDMIHSAGRVFNGEYAIGNFKSVGRHNYETLARHNDSVLRLGGADTKKIFTPVYPLLPRSQAMKGLTVPQETYFRRILFEDRWEGFSACFSGWSELDGIFERRSFQVEGAELHGQRLPERSKGKHLLFINQAPPLKDSSYRHNGDLRGYIIDRDNAVFVPH